MRMTKQKSCVLLFPHPTNNPTVLFGFTHLLHTMAPKKSTSSTGGTSIARAVGRVGKNSLGGVDPLHLKKAASAAITSNKAKESSVTPITYTKEQLALAEGREELDPNNRQYNAFWEDVKKKMGMPKHAPSECFSVDLLASHFNC
jgi:hypothetical protein